MVNSLADDIQSIPNSPRPLPADADSQITKLYKGDPLPDELSEIPRYAGPSIKTGRIYVNGKVWDSITDSQRARLFWEEAWHKAMIDATPKVMRWARAVVGSTNLGKIGEEYLAARFAMQSSVKAIQYVWGYPGISFTVAAAEAALGAMVLSWPIGMSIDADSQQAPLP